MIVWTTKPKNDWARIYWARIKRFFAQRRGERVCGRQERRELLNRVAELEKKVRAHNDALVNQSIVKINNIFDAEACIIFLNKNRNFIMNMIADEAQKNIRFKSVFKGA